MTKVVAFLRAINVGGNNLLPMKTLSAILAEVGFSDIRTHLQSGNVVFSAATNDENELAELVERSIEQRCAFRPAVLIRSQAEMNEIVGANPFASGDFNPSRLITVFLRSAPSEQAIARLNESTFADVSFAVRGREMYVKYSDGMGTSKFVPAYYERRLGTIGTARNWNTVLKMRSFLQD